MIDDQKLEDLIGVVRTAAKVKEAADTDFETTKAQIPVDEERAEQAQTRYEKALADLAQHIAAL